MNYIRVNKFPKLQTCFLFLRIIKSGKNPQSSICLKRLIDKVIIYTELSLFICIICKSCCGKGHCFINISGKLNSFKIF